MEVEYIQSMYGVRQTEVFSIGQRPVFHLGKVLFGSLAAALYYNPEPVSGLKSQGEFWVIQGEDKEYPVLRYRFGAATHPTLKVMSQTMDLSDLTGNPDGLIRIELEKRSRFTSLIILLRDKGLLLLRKMV